MNQEDDYLMLSGIQHFLFCKRQWALIHIAQVWTENTYTAEGQIVHKKVDQPFLKEKRKEIIISRAMAVSSKKLGLTGILDVIEFHKDENGVELKNKKGKWKPVIVEYKRGQKKKYDYDNVQLMAQAKCIEEDFNTSLEYGYIYYHKTDTREKVEFTKDLRNLTIKSAELMHQFYKKRYIPKAEYYKNCRLCSINEECRPRLSKKVKNINNYIYGAHLWKNYLMYFM